MNYPRLQDLQAADLKGKKVLVRFDFNVPVANGKVVDDYRIQKSLGTLSFLRERGAKIIIIGHIEGETDTLRPVYEYLKEHHAEIPLTFCEDCVEEGCDYAEKMNEGDVILCENLRLYDGEKRNDEEFAKKLAAMGDVYVNDAFSVSHRKHASVVGVAKCLPSYLGLQFEQEIANLETCFKPNHPFLFILGGAKFDTKLPLVEKFLGLADTIFVGGALANDIYKAKGLAVGKSLVADQPVDLSKLTTDLKIMVPSDVLVQPKDSVGTQENINIVDADKVGEEDVIMDAGTATMHELQEKINAAEHILWNGPLGNYEKGFKQPTLDLAKLISEATARGAKTILGGGDTLAAIAELGLDQDPDSFTFVSTGGGAMLDYLANESLPGLDVLKKKK